MTGRLGCMTKSCNFIRGMKPIMMMITANLVFGGMSVLYKIASNDNMSLRILIAYRFIIAAVFSVPIAFYTERYI